MYHLGSHLSNGDVSQAPRPGHSGDAVPSGGNGFVVNPAKKGDNRMIIYDLATGERQSCVECSFRFFGRV